MDETIVNVTTAKFNALIAIVQAYGAAFAVKILTAIAFWIVGRWLIGFAVHMVQKALGKQKVDPTVLRYVGSAITVTLNIILVIGILGYLGMQTTTFAALLAAVGLAIGMAWSGLLANLAAGAFIIVLRPFKVGDFICAGGVTGTVTEIGLFATAINTPDNVLTRWATTRSSATTSRISPTIPSAVLNSRHSCPAPPTGRQRRPCSRRKSRPSPTCSPSRRWMWRSWSSIW
jgi:small conductance mechanosensitive channel